MHASKLLVPAAVKIVVDQFPQLRMRPGSSHPSPRMIHSPFSGAIIRLLLRRKIGRHNVPQQLVPVDLSNKLAYAVVVRDVGGIFRQYVLNDLADGMIFFLLQRHVYALQAYLIFALNYRRHLTDSFSITPLFAV